MSVSKYSIRVRVRENTNYRGRGKRVEERGADGALVGRQADRKQTRDQNWLKAVKMIEQLLHCTYEYYVRKYNER